MKVLIADDSRIQRDQIRAALSQIQGWTFHEVDDGEPALEYIRKEKPDLILLDIVMNGMTGLEVIQAMMKEGIKTPVMLTTSMGQDGVAHQAGYANVIGFVMKPYTPELIIAQVLEALDGLDC